MAKHHHSSRHRRRIPKARRLVLSPLNRTDVTRGEYNRLIDNLNERTAIFKALRDSVTALQQTDDVQFKRIAQIQADLDGIRRVWEKMKITT